MMTVVAHKIWFEFLSIIIISFTNRNSSTSWTFLLIEKNKRYILIVQTHDYYYVVILAKWPLAQIISHHYCRDDQIKKLHDRQQTKIIKDIDPLLTLRKKTGTKKNKSIKWFRDKSIIRLPKKLFIISEKKILINLWWIFFAINQNHAYRLLPCTSSPQ